MARVFEAKLSLKDLRQLQKDLRYYRKYTLTESVEKFVNELLDRGISIAYQDAGEFQGFIGFYKEMASASRDTDGANFRKYNYRVTGYLIGANVVKNIVKWNRYGKEVEEEISSILMAEYGSGKFADKKHRGTYPTTSTNNPPNAMRNMWFYTQGEIENGKLKWYKASGVKPTMPMYHAFRQMQLDVYRCAIDAFQRTP